MSCHLTIITLCKCVHPRTLQVVPGFPFFASRVLLGKDGVSKVYGLGKLDAFETKALEALKPELMGSIEKGVAFAAAAAAPAAAAPSA